jgi:hypothetical protein
MLNAKGQVYSGKLGEIHKIQTVEYDLMQQGEVVTECGGETYSIDSDDFRNSFEMVHDEEGMQTNNESVIKEEIKKLSKIKDYFGKNIKESIERLEAVFLNESTMNIYDSSIDHGKRTVSLIFDGRFNIKTVNDYMRKNYDTEEFEVTDYSNPITHKGLENPGVVDIQIHYYDNENPDEPEDAYLDQSFEDNISGDGSDLDETKLKEFEYEDSDEQIEEPEDDEYQQNKRWSRVNPKFYYDEDFDSNDLLIFIFNDQNENIGISKGTEGSEVLSFQSHSGKSIDIQIAKIELDTAIQEAVSYGFVNYDSEGGVDYYVLTDKGFDYCSQNKFGSKLEKTLRNIKEIQ